LNPIKFASDVFNLPSDRKGLKVILANASWLLFDKVLRMGLGLLIGAWIARHLGPENFGIYNYAIAFASIFGVFATLGLDSIVVRELVRRPSDTAVLLGNTFVLRLASGIVSFVVCYGTVWLLNHERDPVVPGVALVISLSLVALSFDTIDIYFQSQVKSKFTVIAKNISFLLISGVKLILLYQGAGLVAFAWTYTAEILLNGVFMIVVLQLHMPVRSLFRFQFQQGLSLLRGSWPLIFSGLIIILYMRTDQLMLKEILGNRAVGIYSVAVRISEVWYIIPGVIMSSVFPAIIRSKETDEKLFLSRMQTLYTSLTWMSIAIAIVVTVFSGEIIYILFRESYDEAATILSYHVWTGVFVFQGTARGYWLLTEHLQFYGMIYTGAAFVTNVILNYFLINIYGINGAAVATLISYFCSVIVFPLLVAKTRSSSIQLLKSFIWKMK
jgi:polysaccharide transporter, PST family